MNFREGKPTFFLVCDLAHPVRILQRKFCLRLYIVNTTDLEGNGDQFEISL